jgi:PAB1-binding protein PBP1
MPPHKKPEISFNRLRAIPNEQNNTITIRVDGRKNPTETYQITQTFSVLSYDEKKELLEVYKRSFFAPIPRQHGKKYTGNSGERVVI